MKSSENQRKLYLLAVPTFVNVAAEVEDQFLQAQASAIFE